jgi:autotransporter-associated beta strand protein
MVFNSQDGDRALTLAGTNTGANTMAALISDNVGFTSLVKTGAGTWIITGANTYTGTTSIQNGTLSVSSLAASAAISPMSRRLRRASSSQMKARARRTDRGSGAKTRLAKETV